MENNNQNIKLCPTCGAKNKSIYKYCNECGAALNQSYYTAPKAEKADADLGQNPGFNNNQNFGNNPNQTYYNGQFNQGGYTPYAPYGNYMNAPYYGTPDFNGVSAKDVYDFTGQKEPLFNKIKIQHFLNKNGPFCWPLFFLGLIFGTFGMGCWFFYHKMYKPALGFFASSIVEVVLSCYVLFYTVNSLTDEQIKAIIRSAESMDFIMPTINNFGIDLAQNILSIISLGALVCSIVLPFFAYKWYKNFALQKISEEYGKSPMPNILGTGVTKGGTVAILAVSYAAICVVVLVLAISPFISRVFKISRDENVLGNSNYYNQLPYGEDYYSDDDIFGGQNPFGELDPFEEFDPFGDGGYGYGEEPIPFAEETPKGEYW